jgi:small subunit ribosomal protein S5
VKGIDAPAVEVVKVSIDEWKPKTELGRRVKNKEITDIDYILDNGLRIMEPEIVDLLLPDMQTELLLVGQSKGKFGGGQRRVFRQTQKKTREGNKPSFATVAVIGNKNGIIGIGQGKSKETVPARDKALRNAKLNLIKIRRGSGAWESTGKEFNSLPFKVKGRCGLSEIILIPAPRGVGLCVEKECQKMLKLAGIEDVWSRTFGNPKTKINLVMACFDALKKLMEMKVPQYFLEEKDMVEGIIKVEKNE